MTRRARAALVLLVSAALLAPPPAPVAGQVGLPLFGGEVVFAGARKGGFDLLTVDPATGSVTNLTQTPGAQELDPAWSPDGARIAFARKLATNPSPDIYVRDAVGNELRLTQDFGGPIDRQPAWSPDGTRIAWTRSIHFQGVSQIFTMNADGSGATAVTDAVSGRFDSSPAWSPDGSRIAFVSDRDSGFPDLWVANADGTGRERLTRTGKRIEGNPAWSPDGSRILFDRCCPGGSWELFTMNADGSGQTRLTTTGRNEVQAAWSPDGQHVAFSAYPPGGGDKDLWVMRADGTEAHKVLETKRAELSPSWSGGALLPRGQDSPPPSSAGRSSGPKASSGGGGGQVGSALNRSKTSGVMKGVQLIKGRYARSDVYVLKVDPSKQPTMDVALGGNVLPGRERTSSMAKRHGAVAAINGDFPLPSGKPSHPFAEDGDLKTSSLAGSNNFAIRADERNPRIGNAVEVLKVLEADSNDVWTFDRWNDGVPTWGEIAAYSPAGRAKHGRPPKHACSARLMPDGPRRWAPGMNGVRRDYEVDAVACRKSRMGRKGGVVLSAQPGSQGGIQIQSLRPGETVSLTWSFRWKKVADSMGGMPRLVRDGAVVAEPCGAPICGRHPRTGIGVTGNDRLLLVVVDGRRKGSKGMKLVRFARLFRDMGAKSALNLDGGGSSTMVVAGKIVNVPSDGSERAVSSAILVLAGKDKGEKIGGPGSSGDTSVAATSVPATPGPSLLDPASTGGLLDAMARGLFGGRLPPELLPALRAFRSSG
ncbi:MAG: phosphodiester glycosidase family protein [Actinomycetota bacterium]